MKWMVSSLLLSLEEGEMEFLYECDVSAALKDCLLSLYQHPSEANKFYETSLP